MQKACCKGKTKEISNDLRKVAVKLKSEDKSLGEISETLGLPKSTIKKINEKYQATGSIQNKSRSGRPRKTSQSCNLLIVMQFKSNRRKAASEVANEMLQNLGIQISPQMVRNRLHA